MGRKKKEEKKDSIIDNSKLIIKKEPLPLDPPKIYEKYIQSYGNMDFIKKDIDDYGLTLDSYCEILLNYIKYNVSRSKHASFFDHIDLMDFEKKNIINYCNNSKLSYREIKANIINYILIYRPDILLNPSKYDILNKKIDVYRDYLNSLNETNNYTTSISYYKQLFQVFMEEDYSIQRFCYQHRILVSTFKSSLDKIRRFEPNLYLEILNNIEYKEAIKEKTISFDVYDILSKIKELKNDFSIIDFLSLTNYSYDEIIQEADKILDLENKKLLRVFVSSYKPIKPYSDKEINKFLEEKIVYNIDNVVIEIPNEVKEEIINYLKEKSIPICTKVFHDACLKYYRGTLFTKYSK